MGRREELLAAATDYALGHGLIGLSLRPLAQAIGTSDRMLLYHFKTKDHLVAAVLRESNDRSIAHIRAMPPSGGARQAVLDLWAASTSPQIAACTRMYVEASALGLLGKAPYAAVVREFNTEWLEHLSGHLVASGVPAERAERAASLVDYAFLGLMLDQQVEPESEQRESVEDLAVAVERWLTAG